MHEQKLKMFEYLARVRFADVRTLSVYSCYRVQSLAQQKGLKSKQPLLVLGASNNEISAALVEYAYCVRCLCVYSSIIVFGTNE